MSANANNPYNKGFIISYKELDTSLQRNKVIYNKSEDDITHQVIPGDRLDALAYKYLGSSKLWYMIADANDIDDQLINPFELTTGLILIIPNKSKFESLQS